MGLGEFYSKSVVLISGAIDVGVGSEDAPLRGTGFLTMIPSVDPHLGFTYVVTAAHVVRPFCSTFIKLLRRDGTVADLPVSRWVFHATEDIAVGTFEKADLDYDHYYVAVKEFVGADADRGEPGPGDDVFFAGLLAQVPSMGAKNIPMVRKGSIGALDQDEIPMRMPGDTFIRAHGHLIDCQSFGGFSGSPCFVRYVSGIEKTPNMGLTTEIRSTLLLGMVGGHFDQRFSVTLPDQEGKVDIPIASGVAVVYPAEAIRETLDVDTLVAERGEFDEGVPRPDRTQGSGPG